jgi:archaetidylinositol phosphate synthase
LVSSILKKIFEETVKKSVIPLGALGVTPNHVTVAGLLISLLAMWFFINWRMDHIYLLASAVMILFSGFLDAIDGVLARNTGKVSRFGGFLDSVSDRYSDAIYISGIIIGGLCTSVVGLAALVGALMVSYTRSRAEAEGVQMAGVGFAERAERMLFLALCSVAAYFWLPSLEYGVLFLAVISHGTVLQRVLYFKKKV